MKDHPLYVVDDLFMFLNQLLLRETLMNQNVCEFKTKNIFKNITNSDNTL